MYGIKLIVNSIESKDFMNVPTEFKIKTLNQQQKQSSSSVL